MNRVMDTLITTAQKNMHNVGQTFPDGTRKIFEEGGDIPAAGDYGKAAMVPGDKYAPDALRYIKKDGQQYVRPIIYKRKTKTTPEGETISEVAMEGDKPLVDMGASQKLIPINIYRDNLASVMFSGKVLQGELGTEYKSPDFTPETGTPSSAGDWKSRRKKVD